MLSKIFVSFEHTITPVDLNASLANAFGDASFLAAMNNSVCDCLTGYGGSKEASAKMNLRKLCESFDKVSWTAIEAHLDSIPIDETFLEFVEFCRARNIECSILSESFDGWIARILTRFGIRDIPIFANNISIESNNGHTRILPTFPYDSEECRCCACCKRDIIVSKTPEEGLVVFVGNHPTDFCPARYADVVFAKEHLQSFCQSENISYHRFKTFRDAREQLSGLLEKKRIHRRREATVNRQALYVAG